MFEILTIIAGLLISPAEAQNVTCATRPPGDSTNACASTAFVHQGFQPLLTLPLSIVNGGTGTSTPGLIAGAGISITGSWPDNTITNTGAAGILNASGLSENTTGNCVASNTAITIAAAQHYVNGQGIALEHCGTAFATTAPTGLTVASTGGFAQGPAGSTTYSYQIACVDNAGGVGVAVTAVTITNGAATLGTITAASQQLAYNQVSWTNGGSCSAMAVWRNRASAGYVLAGVVPITVTGGSNNTFTDSGLTASVPYVPSTPTASALADRFVTTISSGGGTTSLVLAAGPTTAVTSAYVRHDDTAALNTYLAATLYATVPTGSYQIESVTLPTSLSWLVGSGRAATTLVGWSASTPVLSATSLPTGFKLSDLAVSPIADSANGLNITSTNGIVINDNLFKGNTALSLSSVQNAQVNNNQFSGQFQNAIVDSSGLNNNIGGNNVTGCRQVAACLNIFITGTNLDIAHDNIVYGPGIFGIEAFASNFTNIEGNTVFAMTHEGAHVGQSGLNNSITNNKIITNGSGIDYCISVSNDNASSVTISGTVVDGNLVEGCGVSGIALQIVYPSGGGSGAIITNTTISGNKIYSVNTNALGGSADIILAGTGVTLSYINGNTHLSGASVTWDVEEVNSGGLPASTQVGAEFGIAGASGTISLSGAGSVVLTAATSTHSTGF